MKPESVTSARRITQALAATANFPQSIVFPDTTLHRKIHCGNNVLRSASTPKSRVQVKLIFLAGLVFCVNACSLVSFVRTERLVKVPVERVADREPRQSLVPVAQLLAARQVLCRLPVVEQASRLRLYRGVFIDKNGDEAQLQRETNAAVSKETHLFYALMLASCDPLRTPGAMSELLSAANAVGGWPEEHEALIELLMAEHDASKSLNDKYRDLLQQHEKTIQGIKNIEAEIDKAGESEP